MSHILVSGANGFVGRVLCRRLAQAGHRVTGLVRRSGLCDDGTDEWVESSPDYVAINEAWPADLQIDCVIHLAARVHVMNESAVDPDAAFRATNVDGTLRLMRAAHERGVQRFIFVSSIKAVAERDDGVPLNEHRIACPEDAYGRSKRAAEEALVQYGDQTGFDVVIVRPPLVYGPHVRANFLRLMRAVSRGIPLPLGAIDAHRSLLFVENLADALMLSATDPRARRGCFHVADEDAPSTVELVRELASRFGTSPRLLPVPVAWLRAAGRLTGRSAEIDRLVSSLRVDTANIREVLQWRPGFTLSDGLTATADWYRASHGV
jgi:nucleoside-diphosphate-sugar epimerase